MDAHTHPLASDREISNYVLEGKKSSEGLNLWRKSEEKSEEKVKKNLKRYSS